MATIPRSYEGEPDLHHLQVLEVLLREHSLTRAARALNVTQPALSKTLAHLRRYFDDPLFVRVALRMEHLEPWLESGKLDFAMGSFPSLTKGIRRQPLWVERYVSVVKRTHPRISSEPTLRAFAAEKHVLVSIAGSGHAHQLAERALEAAIPAENIICRIPMFIGAAIVAKHTDAVATLPLSVATVLADDLDLRVITPPLKLPKIDIYQYWHDRLHRDPGNQWIRSIFKALFSNSQSAGRAGKP